MRLLLYVAVMALLFSACYERVEGCLDLQATNFELSADRPCEDCCTYPTWKLSPQHRVVPADNPDTSLAFSYDAAYAVAPNLQDSFRFQQIFFYLYDFSLKGANGTLEVSDEFSWYDAAGVQHAGKDDYLLVDAGTSVRMVIGTLRDYGVFDSLVFWVGLPPEIQQADIARMPAGHPLQFRADSLNWEEGIGYIPFRLALYRDASQLQDSVVLRIFEPVRVSLSANDMMPIEIEQGQEAVIELTINYLAWLQGADVQQEDIPTLQMHIRQRLVEAFSL